MGTTAVVQSGTLAASSSQEPTSYQDWNRVLAAGLVPNGAPAHADGRLFSPEEQVSVLGILPPDGWIGHRPVYQPDTVRKLAALYPDRPAHGENGYMPLWGIQGDGTNAGIAVHSGDGAPPVYTGIDPNTIASPTPFTPPPPPPPPPAPDGVWYNGEWFPGMTHQQAVEEWTRREIERAGGVTSSPQPAPASNAAAPAVSGGSGGGSGAGSGSSIGPGNVPRPVTGDVQSLQLAADEDGIPLWVKVSIGAALGWLLWRA